MTQYYDPKNESGGEKKVLLAFLLVFVGIVIMQYLAPKPAPPPQPKPEPSPQQTAVSTPSPSPPPTPGRKEHGKPGKVNTAAPVNVPIKQAASETETAVENTDYRIVFTNRGAVVTHWLLKKYKNESGKPCNAQSQDGCLDLVNPVTAQALGYPLSLFSYDGNLQKKLNEVLYVASNTGTVSAPASLRFEYADGDTVVQKSFSFSPDSYVIGIDIQVTEHGNSVQAFPQWPGGFGDQTSIAYFGKNEIVREQDGKVTRKSPQSGFFLTGKSWVVGGQTIDGPFNWVATVDAYFAAAFMPDSPRDAALVTFHNQVEIPREPSRKDSPKDKAAVLGIAVGSAKGSTSERLFAGPKAVEILESVPAQPSEDLRGVIDFGWFGFIARPLFLWLKWTYYHWIPNWGWAIAFLTLVITAGLLPLRISSMKSSLKMQKIQPQVKAITEKYKRYSMTDPRRAQMQQEMSVLYKKEGVNPLGGCLPMLLQLPFLYAFYAMLGNAIELRQANWLWIRDLSSADPVHILPIGIMITMFLSSKSMPQGGIDPTQQKMMQLFTPLMLGMISWSLPAGLGIYWAISNLLMWVQQIAINQTEFGKQVRKTVAKRALKKR